jgi:hydroxyacylglutathione hydrolase
LFSKHPEFGAETGLRRTGRTLLLAPSVSGRDPALAAVTTLKDEKQRNTFLRSSSPGVTEHLRASFPDLPEHPDARTVFVKLRELRNKW